MLAGDRDFRRRALLRDVTTAGKDTPHRHPVAGGRGVDEGVRRFSRRTAGARLCRRREHHDRVSALRLGLRPIAGDGGRSGSAAGRCHRHRHPESRTNCAGRHSDDPNRRGHRRDRSGGSRARHEPWASGRQPHRLYRTWRRAQRQAGRNPQRGCSKCLAHRRLMESGNSCLDPPGDRGSGPHPRAGLPRPTTSPPSSTWRSGPARRRSSCFPT